MREAILARDEARLRSLALSWPKSRYVRETAETVHSGTLDFDQSRELGDEEVVANLVPIKDVVRCPAQCLPQRVVRAVGLFPAGCVCRRLRFADDASTRTPAEPEHVA
jgi:3-methyladenine DNA glycosylase/8-oxoguanine DNA glycosylase